MSIPTGNEVQQMLDEIALEMARVKEQINARQATIAPLNTERDNLKEKVKTAEDKYAEESTYAYDQRSEAYKIYKQVEAMWEKYLSDCRALKEAELSGVNQRIAEIRTEVWDTEIELKKLRLQLEALERRWDLAQRQIKDAANYASIKDRMDTLTMGAPWREWAKDHQIDGGRRIAYRGKLLLGDTMGLGKTLTSVIAMDFIRAMTAEADAEHPVVIETN